MLDIDVKISRGQNSTEPNNHKSNQSIFEKRTLENNEHRLMCANLSCQTVFDVF